jgi:hypothetical protein
MTDFPQFPLLEITERNDYNSYRHMMFMLPILLNAKLIAETGLGNGHSTRIWMESLSQLPGDRYLFTFELEPKKEVVDNIMAVNNDINHKNVWWQLAQGKSVERVAILNEHPEWHLDFLYLDSDHSYDNVYAELEAFKPYLSPKAWIMSDDAWSFGAPLEIPNKTSVYFTRHPGKNPSDVYYAAKEWADKNNWKTMMFTETRGLAPEGITTAGPVLLHR